MRGKNEDSAIEQFEAEGYDVIKVGIPDLILLKEGKIRFIEIKTTGKLKRDQKRTHELFRKHNISVEVFRLGEQPSTNIRISVELRDTLKSQRRIKPDGELETIEEVLLRLTREADIDLKERIE